MTTEDTYPVSVRGEVDPNVGRWLWLVKWLLIIPHVIVLVFLWIAFLVVTIIAFFAILFNGQYPRSLFDFNVGVMRWTWRVAFYSYNALATDRYPPFSLDSQEDYPADLSVEYPENLSRGLVLVKWWLLAIPHYIVSNSLSNLVTALSIFGGVSLLFNRRYPDDISKLVIGFNRWTLRVLAYAALMTDKYPPFRLEE